MTFKKWILQFINEDSPIGDLAYDNNMDPTFPNSYSYKKIRAHLERQNASELCMKSFQDAWKRYKNRNKHKGEI
ncbi:YozE family protein [Lysinibacillus fusiformis]|uniref:YozE family protein n=1 Tax=Lysinibacillus fusiformis TaxID=28031 RepID=UPI0030195B9A